MALVTKLMCERLAVGEDRIAFIPITTSGDRIQDRALADAGGKGLFSKELDEALLDGRIDCAVHSMKDLPAVLPDGIALAAAPAREDKRDAFVSLIAKTIGDLPQGAVVGTSSVRRQAQLLHARRDLKVTLLRGNVDTRLRKLAEGEADATFLAFAGLKRLGLEDKAASLIDPTEAPPAACQGALAITTREADAETFAPLDDLRVRIEISAERAFLAALDGSCRTPLGAYCEIANGELAFTGELLRHDGSARWRAQGLISPGADPAADAAALGQRLGAELRAIADREDLRAP